MPLGMVNFSFDLLAPWRLKAGANELSAGNMPAQTQNHDESGPVARTEQQREHEQGPFWSFFPAL
ncbi:hypothetical protein [Sinorhizobium americanum]|uniref:hypothetical protein n=1 Tax=Sinorhizobium americanum TaxID=194963 RepID=UPI0012EB1A07|nr:hypothetical protein [Sinorhizobium americanum]